MPLGYCFIDWLISRVPISITSKRSLVVAIDYSLLSIHVLLIINNSKLNRSLFHCHDFNFELKVILNNSMRNEKIAGIVFVWIDQNDFIFIFNIVKLIVLRWKLKHFYPFLLFFIVTIFNLLNFFLFLNPFFPLL